MSTYDIDDPQPNDWPVRTDRVTDRCDMYVGACACGTWHGSGPWVPMSAVRA